MVEGALKTRVTKPKGEISKGDHRIPFLRVGDTRHNDVRGHEEGDPGWSVPDSRGRSARLKTRGELEGESERETENEITI